MNINKRINNVFVLSIVAVCFFLFLSQTAIAATYYVSPSGNDANNGLSTTAAWKNPSYAASRAVAGDTIYLMNGIWYNQHVVFNKKGTSTAPITMKAYSGTPVLDGVDKTGFGIKIYSSSWINIEGINIKNYQYGYWATYSNHLKLVNSEISNIAMDGIDLWTDVDYATLDSVTVKNVGDHGIHLWNQDKPSRSQYITIKNCVISNAPHNLLDIHTNVTDVVLENNEFFFTSDFTTRQVGLYLHNGNTDNIVIKNNYFHDQGRPLEIFNSKNVQVTGNTFRNINGKAIMLASVKGYDTDLGVFDSSFTGNTFDNVYYAFCLWGGYSNFKNLYFANNNFAKVVRSDYSSTSDYYILLTGNSGLPQILNSKDQYYTVRDVISSPYTPTSTSTDTSPVARAGADVTITAGSSVTFNGGASTDDKGISLYSWDFDSTNGIQSEATGKTVSRVFKTAGKFTVTLTVTDTAGKKSSDTLIVTVNAPGVVTDNPPVAQAGADVTITAGSSVAFNGGASTDDKGISLYSWDFDSSNGIQSEATGKTVSRVFATAGKFTVTLTVTDTAGKKSSDTLIVTVNAPGVVTDNPPVAQAGADVTITAGSSVAFNGGASTDDKGISLYSWDFDSSNGIQSEATGKAVSRVFATAGKFTVTLTVTDTAGKKSSDTLIVTVNAPVVSGLDKAPIANAGYDRATTVRKTVYFGGDRSTDDKGIKTYSWDFDASNGIQTDASGMYVSRAYTTAKTYTVTLTVTDTIGQKSSDTVKVTVNP